ncbi:IclR family transcriptional regulator [Halosolutus halophilus]|uniref:IclR family transcriptional regulator n=1 Tax=Halosolutus halophilus TaxID=1552990 RepID=UPI0022350BDB|nr:IclR family transcriptional regulator [Halosolutus halophilus]
MNEHQDGPTERRTVNAVQFSCDILDALKRLNGAGVTEIANHLDASKGAVHTHLATLEANEFVVKRDDEYRLSLRFLDLGKYVRDEIKIYDVVEEEIERLADVSGEVAQFMVEQHGRGVYLYKAEGENAVQTASYVGGRNPMHCTALGKAILAHLPGERVREIIDRHGLAAKTSNTITEREELLAELEEIQERGLAYDREEIFKGLQCVAAPVLDRSGDVIGAVSVTGPTSRMQGDRLEEEVAEMVQHTSNVIEVNAAQVQ